MRQLFLLYILLCCSLLAGGQTFHFRHLNMTDGLPANGVRNIIQDKYGFMWFGTDNGLCKYDGKQITTFTVGESFESQYISALTEHNGYIYIGTDHGVYALELLTEKIRKIYTPEYDTASNYMVLSISTDKDGKIWMATNKYGIISYDAANQKSRQFFLDTLKSSDVVFAAPDGRIWATSKHRSSEVFVMDDESECFKPLILKNTPKYMFARSIAAADNGKIWYGTWENGLFLIDSDGVAEKIPIPDDLLLHIHCIHGKSSSLLVGSDNGLVSYNPKTHKYKHFTSDNADQNSLSSCFVYALCTDRENGLWVGTFYGGVNYSSETNPLFENLTSLNYKNSLTGNVVSHICGGVSGTLYFATDDGGVNSYEIANQHFVNYLKSKNVHAICFDGKYVWSGTYSEGLFRLDPKTGAAKPYSPDNSSFDGWSCYAIFCGNDDTIFAASWDAFFVYDRVSDDFSKIGALSGIAYDIDEDFNGNLWISTQGGGLYFYDKNGGTLQHVDSPETVNCFVIDGKRNAYAGTNKGLFRFSFADKKFTQMPFAEVEVNSLEVCNGLFYIGTPNGLAVFDGDNYQMFDHNDGLHNTQFVANSSLKASDGKIYMGTVNGVVVFHPDDVYVNYDACEVKITGVDIFDSKLESDTAIHLKKEIYLSEDSSVVEFTFAAINYSQNDKNIYAIRVDGIDTAWVNIGKRNHISLNYLPEGEYLFRVKSATGAGIWGKETTFAVIVKGKSPIWLFAIVIAVAAAAVAFYLIIYKKKPLPAVDIEVDEPTKTETDNPVPLKIEKKKNADEELNKKFLDSLEQLIIDNIDNPDLSGNFISERIGVSRSGLFAKTKQLTGKTPNEIITNIRLKRAAELIAENKYKINEVAYMVGFNNPSYFSKLFYKQYGVKPSDV